MIKLASIKSCTGCMACVDVCPKQCISPIRGDDGHSYVTIEHDSCIKCHKCEKICPVVSHYDYAENRLDLSQPYAAYATDANLRKNASSGGVFAAFAQYIISMGGVVYGAELSNNQVKHTAITHIEEIHRLQGSKYMPSNTTGVYKEIKKNLDNDRPVLFTGVGCQVAGVLSFFKKHPHRNKLYTIDLICGGVPSPLLVERFINESPLMPSQIVAFRDGKEYTFSYRDSQNNIIKADKSLRALPLYGFTSGLTNRYSCNNCPCAGTYRRSSITIGDFWHDLHSQGHRSVIVCHNESGEELIEKAALNIEKISWRDFLPYNSRMAYGKTLYSYRPERIFLGKILGSMSYPIIEKIYATKITPRNILWFLYKIERYLFQKLNTTIMKGYARILLMRKS